jgi:hypothetical protein
MKMEKVAYNQIWNTENAKLDRFSNGDQINISVNNEEWCFNVQKKIPSIKIVSINGKNEYFYNHFAVNDIRGIGQDGFHVPTIIDHDQLIEQIGGWEIVNRAQKLHDKLKLSDFCKGNIDAHGEHVGIGLYGAWWISLQNCQFNLPEFQSLYFALNFNLSFEESHWRKQTYIDMGYQILLVKNKDV